jgi:hypothetical protein
MKDFSKSTAKEIQDYLDAMCPDSQYEGVLLSLLYKEMDIPIESFVRISSDNCDSTPIEDFRKYAQTLERLMHEFEEFKLKAAAAYDAMVKK